MIVAVLLGAAVVVSPYSYDILSKVMIQGSIYESYDDATIQVSSSFFDDDRLQIIALSDIIAPDGDAESPATRIAQYNPDIIILAGNTFSAHKDNLLEYVEPLAEIGVPLFIVPGNEISQKDYEKGIQALKLQFSTVFDIHKRTVNLKGINIVGLGGYFDAVDDGFVLTQDDYALALEQIRQVQDENELNLFVTYAPAEQGIKEIMESTIFSTLHIHGHDHDVTERTHIFPAGISLNVASAGSSHVTLIEQYNGRFSYKEI